MKKPSIFSNWFKTSISLRGLACLLALTLAAGCSPDASATKGGESKRKQMVNPVRVAEAVEKSMPVKLRAVGRVAPYATVSIRAQVSGELVGVHFKDGQYIKAGDPLFAIDPNPFAVELKRTKAILTKDMVQLEHAKKQLKRNASVVGQGYVSEEQYDQAAANAAMLKASVEADRAAVENAEIQLKYCRINSPMDGCAGEVKVHRGNLVKANDNENPLVVINKISPIYVSFFIPERNLPEIKKYMSAEALKVDAAIPGHENNPARGQLTFLDNIVNSATGTIELKATFPNKDKSLWPGQFVNVVLTLASQQGAVVVPSRAVQTGQEGQYVFVAKPNLTVDYRLVKVERRLGDEVVIQEGLRPGERVVTDGQLRLSQDASIKLVENAEGEQGETLQ